MQIWTEEYLIHSFKKLGSSQVLAAKRTQDFPFGPELHLPVEEFFMRSVQDDLTLCDKPTTQMLNDVTAPLCLRCQQFLKNMKVLYWLRRYQSEASTPLFFHPDEQLLTVVNGSAKVTLVSPLYSEKLPFDDKELMAISNINTGNNNIWNNYFKFKTIISSNIFFQSSFWIPIYLVFNSVLLKIVINVHEAEVQFNYRVVMVTGYSLHCLSVNAYAHVGRYTYIFLQLAMFRSLQYVSFWLKIFKTASTIY